MNRRIGALLVAAVAVGGAAVAVVPQHAASVAGVAGAAVVVVLASFALVLVGPLVERDVPVTDLDADPATAHGAPALEPPALRAARRDLNGPVRGGVPTVVRERLVAACVPRLQRHGIDLGSPRARGHGDVLLSAETWTLLTTPPDRAGRTGPPQPSAVAAVVHRTLDELDDLAAAPGGPTGGARGNR